MATFIFTQDSLIGKTSVPTVYARIDDGKVRIYDSFDPNNGGTDEDSIKEFLAGLGGVGLRADGNIDWANTRVERYSWTQDFATMPVSALPSRTTDKYVLYMGSNDLLGATNDFFSTTLGGLKTPSGLKISEIVVDMDTPDPAGLDRLTVSVDQLTKISKAGAKIANVTLSVEDSQTAITTLLGTKPADLKALGNVAVNVTPEQVAKLIADKKMSDSIVKGFTDVGVKVNMAVASSASLAALVANNTDLSSFSTLSVRLESGLVSAQGPLGSGTDEQQMARTEQLGEFITAFSGKSLTVDPGVLLKLISTGVFWDLQPEIGLLKDTIDVRVEASLDRLVNLQTPNDIYRTWWGMDNEFNLSIGDYNVTRALNIFADGLTIVSDDGGASFTRDSQNAELNINSKLLRSDEQSVFQKWDPNSYQYVTDVTSDGVVVHRYGGVLGEMFNRAYEQARNGGWWWGASDQEPPRSVDEAYASAIEQLSKVELKSSDGNLVVTADLAQASLDLGFRFAASDNVTVNLSANQLDTSKSDLVSTFESMDWWTGTNKDFANPGKDGEVDTLADLKALGIRYRNWYNVGDIDGNGADDAHEQVYVPDTNAWVNKIDWMFGFDGTNGEYSFWGSKTQQWLSDQIDDQTFLARNDNKTLHVGFADLDGDGLADLANNQGDGQSVSFAFLRSLQGAGVDSVVSSADIVIDLDPEQNGGNTYSLKSVVNFLKSTKLSFVRADGQVAKISVDSDSPIALSYADITALSKKGIALNDTDGVGLITWSATAADLVASIKALTVTDATSLAQAGVSSIDVLDRKKLSLTAEQAKAVAVSGLTFASGAYVVLSDTAANISALSAAQISALGSMGLNAIDASDNKEITLTDRQIRSLLRADIIVDAGDTLRAKISDDYLLKALEEGGDLGQVLDQLASIGLDRISGSTSGLKMTAKMLTEAMPMLGTDTNPGGLVKISSTAGAVDAKKPLTGIIVTFENESELTFLPATRASLEGLGVKFEQAVVNTFNVAGAAGNSVSAPKVSLAVGRDIVIKAEDFLTQKDKGGKSDVKLTELSLVNDKDMFTVRIKIGESAAGSDASVVLAAEFNAGELFFQSITSQDPSNDTIDWKWEDGYGVGDGVADGLQQYGWAASPFERDWQRPWGDDPNLPRFVFKYSDNIKSLVAEARGEPLTFELLGNDNQIYKFDVEVDRGRMDYINQTWAADGVTDPTPWDDASGDNDDQGELVVFRVVDDLAFEAAVAAAGITTGFPSNFSDPNYGNSSQAWAWMNEFINKATLTTKSVSSSELVTVTLDDVTQDLNEETGEYVVELTGAQLKAGALVVTPNYGADGLDAEGNPLVNIFFEGGRAERTVFSFSNTVNGTDWWRRGETQVVTQDAFGADPWNYAYQNGGTVSYNYTANGYEPVVSITQREFSLKIKGLDLDGSGTVDADDAREITFRANSWVSDQYSVVNDLANILAGAPWGYDLMDYNEAYWEYMNHGISDVEYETIAALQNFVRFSGDNGRLVVDYLDAGDRGADTLVFSEVGMTAGEGKDQDGVDVVRSELYATSGARNYFGVSAASKLTVGDKLKFTITGSPGTASFEATITADLVKNNADPIKLLEAAMKAGLPNDLNFSGTSTKAILKSGIAQTSAKDAVLVTLQNRNYSISVETVSEGGTLLVQQSSKDGAGGNVQAQVEAVKYNAAPEVAYSTSAQEIEGAFGAHVVNLSSFSVIDSSENLQVTLSPTRGAHAGFFQFVDSSLYAEFVASGNLKVQYMDPATNKLVDAKDKLPQGVGKLVITASALEFVIGEETITYKASDIVNLVLSGVTFQLSRGLYSSEDSYATGFDLAINDDYTAAANGAVLAGTFATGGERMYMASVVHGTLEDVTGDNRIDANDAVVKVSTLRQLATNDNQEFLEVGLHMTDSSTDDQSQGIDNDVALSKVFTVTNKTLQHAFNTSLANMMVDEGLTSNSAIFLHADEDLQYTLLDYAKAGFASIYNETANAFSLNVAEVNQLNALGVGVVGDADISFEDGVAETLVAPLRNLQSLTNWASEMATDGVADYVLKNFGAGDKLDLKTLLKVDASKLSLLTDNATTELYDESDPLQAYTAASTATNFDFSTHNLYASYDIELQQVDYYYVGWDQATGEAATKAHFQVELSGLNLTETKVLDTLKSYLV